MIETLSQKRVTQAYELVADAHETLSAGACTVYGRLCHRFPMMVLQGGLLSAVQFAEDKASGQSALAEAYRSILKDLRQLLGRDAGEISVWLAGLPAPTLMAHTLEVLEVFASMRRFAVSVLKVDSGGDDDLAAQQPGVAD